MLRRVPTLLHGRLFLLAWLIAWITTLPLFHIHIPDTTDRWSVLQSGGAHTVFTPDLPGEFQQPFHDVFNHLSPRAVNSPELGIALFDEKSKDQKLKPLHLPYAPFQFPITLLASLSAIHGTLPRFYLPQEFPVSRAPPRVVCA